jgi:glycerol-3-phosphate dehydrogenase
MVSRRSALRDIPALNPSIVALGGYFDAKVDMPERLVFELVGDGLAANTNSLAANYTTLVAHDRDALIFTDRDGRTTEVRPRIVVNAAGPWIDTVNATLGQRTKMIGGTRGSHLLLRHDELVRSLAGRMIYFEADDGRICLVYEYLGLALVGSTDIPDDDPDNISCDAAEVDYLLQSLASLLPGLGFDRAQIVFAYAGVRPLPASDASVPGLISRDHSAPTLAPDERRAFPIVCLVGGKWTTFRGFAAEVADRLLAELGATRKVSTEALPIGGGREFPEGRVERKRWIAAAAVETGLAPERMATLLDRYGTTALAVARHAARFPGEAPLRGLRGYSRGEIDYLARCERVERLADIVLRRSSLAITGALDLPDLKEIAEVVGAALGWSEQLRKAEIEATRAELSGRHLYQFDPQASARVDATTT